jgi:DNA polymerase-1
VFALHQGFLDTLRGVQAEGRLVLLDEDAPLPCPIAEMVARPPADGRLEGFLRAMGFRSLLARMGKLGDGNDPPRRGAHFFLHTGCPAPHFSRTSPGNPRLQPCWKKWTQCQLCQVQRNAALATIACSIQPEA